MTHHPPVPADRYALTVDRDPHAGEPLPPLDDPLTTPDPDALEGGAPLEEADAPGDLPHARTLPPAERQQRNAALQEALSEFITLKDTLESLEERKRELGEFIKARVLAGDRATVLDRRPVLRPNKKRVITFAAFERQFGQDRALECAAIDLKRADALVKAGELLSADLRSVTEYVEGPPALYIVPVSERKR